MTYKESIQSICTGYALLKPNARFIGYNTVYGSRMYGTLAGVPKEQCIETPVAENLMVGLAVGMAIEGGHLPVVCFERHDFLLLALDAIVNHVDKLSYISGGQFKLPIVIRAIVGGRVPMDPGPMHRQDYTSALSSMLKYTPVYIPVTQEGLMNAWSQVGKTPSGAVVIIEHKDDYELNMPADLSSSLKDISPANSA